MRKNHNSKKEEEKNQTNGGKGLGCVGQGLSKGKVWVVVGDLCLGPTGLEKALGGVWDGA